jgi:hypothetical protein
LADSAVPFGKEFFLWKRPFDHFILLDSTFAHYLWQPFTLIENGSEDIASWYRPMYRLNFAIPFEKLEVCSRVHMLRAIDQKILTTPLFFKFITPMASREAHIGSVRHFQMVGIGR